MADRGVVTLFCVALSNSITLLKLLLLLLVGEHFLFLNHVVDQSVGPTLQAEYHDQPLNTFCSALLLMVLSAGLLSKSSSEGPADTRRRSHQQTHARLRKIFLILHLICCLMAGQRPIVAMVTVLQCSCRLTAGPQTIFCETRFSGL